MHGSKRAVEKAVLHKHCIQGHNPPMKPLVFFFCLFIDCVQGATPYVANK